MPANVDSRITPALHPGNVRSIEGYNEATAPYLAPVEAAFAEAYEGVRAVWEARPVVEKNSAWTPEQRVLELSKIADAKFKRIAGNFDSALGTLDRQIADIERQLTAPIESKAATSIAAEIRAHVKAMSTEERHSFLQDSTNSGDVVTIGAVLGAPAYLSGLTVDAQKAYLRVHHERAAPEVSRRLKAMRGARALLETRGGMLFTEIEKAVGASQKKVAYLRRAQDDATAALAKALAN